MEHTPPTQHAATPIRSRYDTGVLLTKIAIVLFAVQAAWDGYSKYAKVGASINPYGTLSAVSLIAGIISLLLVFAIPACAIVGVVLFAFAQRIISPAALARENRLKLVWGIVLIAAPSVLGVLYIIFAILAFFISGFGGSQVVYDHPIGDAVAAGIGSLVASSFLPSVVCGILLLTSRKKVTHAAN